MLDMILSQWQEVIPYFLYAVSAHTIPLVAAVVVYVVALIFSGKFAAFIRWIYVIGVAGLAAFAFYKRNWALLWILLSTLVLMILVKIIVTIIRRVHQRRADKRFERKALEKAAKRRGTWENKQAYSGAPKPIVDKKNRPERMTRKEVDDFVKYETSSTVPLDEAEVPSDPREEISAVMAELKAVTSQIDTDAVNAAYKEAQAALKNGRV